jgi:uracil-DNA glycosylase
LLNNALTVEAGQAGSHQGKGWEEFTDAAVAAVAAA